ncbi:MAG TPA: WecB/TagA/CpsF family glycosyltransferase [Patescibacteria group bacterium]|nr:WecB/TagA/CpsF family glycosyltransferase [Patescibacteria group bacterium]
MKEVNILGTNISLTSRQEVINKIRGFLKKDQGQYYIVTPNPEIILKTEEDEEFFYIVNKADVAIPDGVGLKIAGWLLGKNISRITGADLVQDVLAIAQQDGLKVGIIKPADSLSDKADIKKTLKEKYPGLKAKIADASFSNIYSFKNKRLKEFEPDILLATLGAPYQEKLIYHNLQNFPNVKLALGVGGALDFLTRKLPRAPKMLRFLGLEWLWRLCKQPRRWKRIYRAVLVFPWRFLKWRFVLPFKYRPNVACLLYKKENGRYKVLVVERREQVGHWQLPQGGTEGEDLVTAGSRELQEELNCDTFQPVATFKKIHKYKFPPTISRMSRHRGYKGQKQGLLLAEFTGEDRDININFWEHQNWKWVDWQNLKKIVPPVRKEAIKKISQKFQETVINKKDQL